MSADALVPIPDRFDTPPETMIKKASSPAGFRDHFKQPSQLHPSAAGFDEVTNDDVTTTTFPRRVTGPMGEGKAVCWPS